VNEAIAHWGGGGAVAPKDIFVNCNWEKARKILRQGKKNLSQLKKNLSQRRVHTLPKHPHIAKPTHIHTHTYYKTI
jgi:hypothetical protein